MGREARARGTFEERKAAALARNAEARKLYYEKLDAEENERDRQQVLLTPEEKARRINSRLAMASYLSLAMGAMMGSRRI